MMQGYGAGLGWAPAYMAAGRPFLNRYSVTDADPNKVVRVQLPAVAKKILIRNTGTESLCLYFADPSPVEASSSQEWLPAEGDEISLAGVNMVPSGEGFVFDPAVTSWFVEPSHVEVVPPSGSLWGQIGGGGEPPTAVLPPLEGWTVLGQGADEAAWTLVTPSEWSVRMDGEEGYFVIPTGSSFSVAAVSQSSPVLDHGWTISSGSTEELTCKCRDLYVSLSGAFEAESTGLSGSFDLFAELTMITEPYALSGVGISD